MYIPDYYFVSGCSSDGLVQFIAMREGESIKKISYKYHKRIKLIHDWPAVHCVVGAPRVNGRAMSSAMPLHFAINAEDCT